MIIFSEIGDKTFLIAALMAMKHPRLVVFTAAFSALICMTILSAILGHAVPTLIPKRYTNLLAGRAIPRVRREDAERGLCDPARAGL